MVCKNPTPIDHFRGEFRFLSNFWPVEIELDGAYYPSVEHAYQASKTFNREARRRIQTASSPRCAKKIGETVDIREDWERIRVKVMSELVEQKFKNPTLAQRLIDTGHRKLSEGNDWGDTFWGVYKGVGDNHLGNMLMNIRAQK